MAKEQAAKATDDYDPIQDIRAELARIEHLSLQGYDADYRAIAERQQRVRDQREALTAERAQRTAQLDAEIDSAVQTDVTLDAAARERSRARLRTIDDELVLAAKVLTRLASDLQLATERAREHQDDAWRRLQAMAIAVLYEHFLELQPVNDLLRAIEEAARARGVGVVPQVSWGEFGANASGTSRFESWLAFVRRDVPHAKI